MIAKYASRLGLLLLVHAWASPTSGWAQSAPRAVPSAAQLKRAIQAVADYDDSATPDLDIEAVATKTARQVAAYLQAHEVAAAEAEKLGLQLSVDSEDARHLRVYTFGYTSGGTRGGVSVPVLQWRNQAGQLAAYPNFATCTFDAVYKLANPAGRTLYLLLGEERLNAPSMLNQALVVELKGKYLLLDKAVFGPQSLLALCNTPMEFDEQQQVLRLDLTEYDPEQQGNNPLAQCGYHGWPAAKHFRLKFSGGHFVQSR